MFYFRKSHLQFTTWSILPKSSCRCHLLIKVRVKVALPKIHVFKFGTIKKTTWKWSNIQRKQGIKGVWQPAWQETTREARTMNWECQSILLFMKSSKSAFVTEFQVGKSDMKEHSDQENYWFIDYFSPRKLLIYCLSNEK